MTASQNRYLFLSSFFPHEAPWDEITIHPRFRSRASGIRDTGGRTLVKQHRTDIGVVGRGWPGTGGYDSPPFGENTDAHHCHIGKVATPDVSGSVGQPNINPRRGPVKAFA